MGEMEVIIPFTCVLQGGMVLWDTACHYLLSALFQGAALHVSLWELDDEKFWLSDPLFWYVYATACTCFRGVDDFTRCYNIDPFVRFLQGHSLSAALSCTLNLCLQQQLNHQVLICTLLLDQWKWPDFKKWNTQNLHACSEFEVSEVVWMQVLQV